MKNIILLITFIVVATMSGNAQVQATQEPTFTPEEKQMYSDAIKEYDKYQLAMKEFNKAAEKFQAADSLLKSGYLSTVVDSFTHIEHIKQENPIQYVKNGELVVEDDYVVKKTRKPLPATQQGLAAYIERLRKVLRE
nr:hypothetical protein [uncultured Draconibacterium sp.]